jgi:hypothetical protein
MEHRHGGCRPGCSCRRRSISLPIDELVHSLRVGPGEPVDEARFTKGTISHGVRCRVRITFDDRSQPIDEQLFQSHSPFASKLSGAPQKRVGYIDGCAHMPKHISEYALMQRTRKMRRIMRSVPRQVMFGAGLVLALRGAEIQNTPGASEPNCATQSSRHAPTSVSANRPLEPGSKARRSCAASLPMSRRRASIRSPSRRSRSRCASTQRGS